MSGDIWRSGGVAIRGYMICTLSQRPDASQRSHLVNEFLAELFADVNVLEAAVALPTTDLQACLHGFIGTPQYAALHNPVYSAISNPWAVTFRNCNEFVLDVLHAAIYRRNDVGRLKAIARTYFVPHTLEVNPLRLFFGTLTLPDVHTIDHHDGELRMATYGSLVSYLEQCDLLAEQFVLRGEDIR
ncbi:MAG: hypothetical protein ACI9W2_005384 [Gammaproteobacteria bacterium]